MVFWMDFLMNDNLFAFFRELQKKYLGESKTLKIQNTTI